LVDDWDHLAGNEAQLFTFLRRPYRLLCPQPDQVWVTVITYIKSPKGRLYLCLANDLFSCPSVGWSAQSCMTTDLILQASHETVLRRKPAS
jgi:putative transposase